MYKNLIEILTENDVDLKPSSNGRLVANCPFHEGDREPSFTIYPNETYFCFGCEVWGDAVKFLIEYKGLTAKEAFEYVGADYIQPKTEKSKVIKVKNTLATWEFLWDASTEYHEYLLGMPGAIKYLSDRGLTSDTISKYRLGYSDGRVLNLSYAWERKLADEIGLMTRKGFETMSHRITIPNIIEEGQVDFLMGRTIINDRVKYLGARMPKPLVGFHEVRHSPVIFTVEGQFDWLTLRQWGYPAICVSGTHLKAYIRLPLVDKQIIAIPDIDDGEGMKAAKKIAEVFGENGTLLDISSLRVPGEKLDINSLAQSEDGEQRFADLVKERILWNIPLSRGQLMKWLPPLVTSELSPLISKPPALTQ